MGGFLAVATERDGQQSADALKVLERKSVAGRVLAVCERSGGHLVLAVERERGLYAGGAKAPTTDGEKRAKENGTERYMRPTADLADFAHAVKCGLL